MRVPRGETGGAADLIAAKPFDSSPLHRGVRRGAVDSAGATL